MPAVHDGRGGLFAIERGGDCRASDFVLKMKWRISNNFLHPSMTFIYPQENNKIAKNYMFL